MEIYIKILSKYMRIYDPNDKFTEKADATNQFNVNRNQLTQRLPIYLV